jgi:hypothetical protein
MWRRSLQTTVVNKRQQKYDIYIGRGSKWGNPYTHIKGKTKAEFIVGSRDESIEKYSEWVRKQPHLMAALHELKGKRLGCYCRPHRCHGDILVELIEEMDRLEEIENFWDTF